MGYYSVCVDISWKSAQGREQYRNVSFWGPASTWGVSLQGDLEHLTQKKSSTNVEVRTGHRARGFTPRPPVQQGSSFLAPHLSLGKLRLQAGSTLGGANSHREEKGLWTFEDLYISSDTPSCPINSSRVLGWEGVGRKPVPPAVSLGKTVAWRLGSLWTAAEMLLLAAAGRAISPLPHLPLLLQ